MRRMITIRPATLADTAAISAVHCSTVDEWRDPYTRQPADEATLNLFGRWYNGGDWMSVETCAIHLNGMLLQGHLPLVAESAPGSIVGEAEYYVNREPAPFGPYLHLSVLYIHKDWQGHGIGRALVEAGVEHARALGCHALTTQPEPEMTGFYRRLGFELWRRSKEMQTATTQPGTEGNPLPLTQLSPDRPPEPLALRIGRYQCGVQGWETLWPSLAIPELAALRRGMWRGEIDDDPSTSSGQVPVVLGLREQFRTPTQADGYAWLPPSASLTPVVAALRALAAREGYSAVDLLLPEDALPELRTTFKLDYQTTVDLWIKQT